MNKVYRDLILARVQAAIGAARAVTNIKHKGLKGQLREIVIRDLFSPLLPADVGVGTGEIISADNRQSRQQDVVIFDKRILPPILLEKSTGIFPIESALYTIEIKSLMTADEIRDSHRNATELLDFEYQSGEYNDSDKAVSHTVTKVISAILAFSTDLAPEGKSEIERYDYIRGTNYPSIKAICVVDKGYWYWYRNKWITGQRTYQFEEVVSFIAGIMNTYRMVSKTRKEPRLGRYLIDN